MENVISKQIEIIKIHFQFLNELGVSQQEILDKLGIAIAKDENKNKVCLHCGGSYVYKTTFQKYCTEICRIEAWELRTGMKMKKGGKSGK